MSDQTTRLRSEHFPWLEVLFDEHGVAKDINILDSSEPRPVWYPDAMLAVVDALHRGEIKSMAEVESIIEATRRDVETNLLETYTLLIDAYLGVTHD